MISVEGAAVIAQVIPVGLLIIVIERRALGNVVVDARRDPLIFWLRVAEMVAIGSVLFAALIAEALCIWHVAADTHLGSDAATVVWTSLIGLGAVTLFVLLALLGATFQDAPTPRHGAQGDPRR